MRMPTAVPIGRVPAVSGPTSLNSRLRAILLYPGHHEVRSSATEYHEVDVLLTYVSTNVENDSPILKVKAFMPVAALLENLCMDVDCLRCARLLTDHCTATWQW